MSRRQIKLGLIWAASLIGISFGLVGHDGWHIQPVGWVLLGLFVLVLAVDRWLRLLWGPGEEPPRSVKMSYHLTLGIAFGEIGLDAEDFPKVAKLVLTIIERFMADFPETVFED